MNKHIYNLVPKLIGTHRAIKLGMAYHKLRSMFKYGTTDMFFDVAIEIENYCNRSCYYCPQSMEKYPREKMSDWTFKLALKRLKQVRFDGQINFAIFNEPLMDARLPEFVRVATEYLPGTRVIINTNGDYLTIPMVEDLLKRGATKFIITEHPPFNANWAARITEIEKKFPLSVRVQRLSPDRLKNVAGLIKDYRVPQGTFTNPCTSPRDVFVIRYNGDVGICCCDYRREVVMGNIVKNTIPEIRAKAEFVKTRQELAKGIRTHNICKGCNGGYTK